MKLLITTQGYIITEAHDFAFGAWEQADKIKGQVVHKWKAVDENGNTTCYIIDENPDSVLGNAEPTCQVVEVDELPEDYASGKYLCVNGAIVVNEDWQEPPKSLEEQIAEQQELINIILGGEI